MAVPRLGEGRVCMCMLKETSSRPSTCSTTSPALGPLRSSTGTMLVPNDSLHLVEQPTLFIGQMVLSDECN